MDQRILPFHQVFKVLFIGVELVVLMQLLKPSEKQSPSTHIERLRECMHKCLDFATSSIQPASKDLSQPVSLQAIKPEESDLHFIPTTSQFTAKPMGTRENGKPSCRVRMNLRKSEGILIKVRLLFLPDPQATISWHRGVRLRHTTHWY